jgi:tRNA A37 methylthiotransferase MiaB
MNESDTEIIISILNSTGYSITQDQSEAELIFLNTCAIRENAESKVPLKFICRSGKDYQNSAKKSKSKINL